MDKKKIGKFIADLRKEKNITQKGLAKKLYIERTTVSKWEIGEYIPVSEDLLKLSEIFNVSINEILAGERKTEENEKMIDNITLEVIDTSNKKLKKIFIIFSSVCILLIILFFLYYFISNYNSISVYKISGENDNFHIQDGLMVVSPEKAYIKLSDTETDLKEIENVRLYYKNNNEEIDIYSSQDTDILLINIFGNDELFTYKDLKILKNNLYLEIKFNEEIETIKLDVVKDFSNNKIFNNKLNQEEDDSTVQIDSDIPEYIKTNFKYNSDERFYYMEYNSNKKTINYKYLIDSKILIVIEAENKSTEQWEYSFNDYSLTYSYIVNDSFENTFTYDFSNNSCINKDCDKEKIKHFQEEHLAKF